MSVAEDKSVCEAHWAVKAIGQERLKRANDLVRERQARHDAGERVDIAVNPDDEDDGFLSHVGLAFEFVVIEGMDALGRDSDSDIDLRNQCVSAAFRAFEILRMLPLPKDVYERVFFVLRLGAYAVCGERWSDLRRWCRERDAALTMPSVAGVRWDDWVLYSLFDCWVRLFRNVGSDDYSDSNELNRIPEIIEQLRDLQKSHEHRLLESDVTMTGRARAFTLMALYNWAKATEILATCLLRGETANSANLIEKHFEAALWSAIACGWRETVCTLEFLKAASRVMVSNSHGGRHVQSVRAQGGS